MKTKPQYQAKPSLAGRPNEFPDITRQLRSRRTGPPRPGCDCVQCFGYCMVDRDIANRDSMTARRERADVRGGIGIAGYAWADGGVRYGGTLAVSAADRVDGMRDDFSYTED